MSQCSLTRRGFVGFPRRAGPERDHIRPGGADLPRTRHGSLLPSQEIAAFRCDLPLVITEKADLSGCSLVIDDTTAWGRSDPRRYA